MCLVMCLHRNELIKCTDVSMSEWTDESAMRACVWNVLNIYILVYVYFGIIAPPCWKFHQPQLVKWLKAQLPVCNAPAVKRSHLQPFLHLQLIKEMVRRCGLLTPSVTSGCRKDVSCGEQTGELITDGKQLETRGMETSNSNIKTSTSFTNQWGIRNNKDQTFYMVTSDEWNSRQSCPDESFWLPVSFGLQQTPQVWTSRKSLIDLQQQMSCIKQVHLHADATIWLSCGDKIYIWHWCSERWKTIVFDCAFCRKLFPSAGSGRKEIR